MQNVLRLKVIVKPGPSPIKIIAGADISFNRFTKPVYAGIILLSFPDLKPIGYSLVKTEVNFPYVPGYLAFREIPALMQAWEQLPVKPDVLIADGHGIAHPRRMGIAAHFGVLTDKPTVGCAKKKLIGIYKEPGLEKFDSTLLYDKEEMIGCVLRAKKNVKPVFISPGHKMDIKSSLELIKKCSHNHRIPEPTRLAHEIVNKFSKGELFEGFHNA